MAPPSREPGIYLGQQGRRSFGLSYRTKIGNDTDGTDHGYKLHLVYGALAKPSEKAYASINDSPEAITFSWDLTTSPVAVTGSQADGAPHDRLDQGGSGRDLAALEDILYGTATDDPRLPLPDEVITLVGTGRPTSI
jgi:hypothetical protein